MLVQHFLEHSAQRLRDKTALICGDQRLTYSQLNDSAERLSAALMEMSIRRQDRVIIFLDNSTECVISIFGILKAGAIFVILNPTMKSKKFSYILKDSGARAIITQGSKSKIVNEAVSEAPDLRHIIWIGKPDSSWTGHTSRPVQHEWRDLFSGIQSPSLMATSENVIPAKAGNQKPLTSLDSRRSLPPDLICGGSDKLEIIRDTLMGPNVGIDVDLATIIYTSGSTGEPKGVMSAHYNMVAAARSITQYLENVEDDIILDALPLSFDYGLYQVIMAFMFGGTVVLEKSFAFPFKVIEKLVQERATGFPIVPTMAAMLLQMESLPKFDFSSLRYITNTAASLPVAYIRKLQTLFPHVKIYSMYGLTECKRVSYLPPDQLDRRPNSVGIPIPNEEVFVVDEKGQEVKPGEIGELVIRGLNVMQGYWNDPGGTSRTFRPGKYRGEAMLYTGDLFKKDEEGFLYFVARKDDMIKTKGERVSPKEIENALCELKGIAEVAVIGVPDEIFGHAIKAFIVCRDGKELSEEQVKKFCMENLEPFMVPKYVEFRKSLPKSSHGKVDKKALEIGSDLF